MWTDLLPGRNEMRNMKPVMGEKVRCELRSEEHVERLFCVYVLNQESQKNMKDYKIASLMATSGWHTVLQPERCSCRCLFVILVLVPPCGLFHFLFSFSSQFILLDFLSRSILSVFLLNVTFHHSLVIPQTFTQSCYKWLFISTLEHLITALTSSETQAVLIIIVYLPSVKKSIFHLATPYTPI